MPKITFVVGLPASGKSSFVDDFIREGVPVFDDFMKGSPSSFARCRHLPKIRAHLNQDRDIVLTDILLVQPAFRDEVIQGLALHAARIEWVFFENNPAQCLKNSARRARSQNKDHQAEVGLIRDLSLRYTYPDNRRPLPVASPADPAPKPARHRFTTKKNALLAGFITVAILTVTLLMAGLLSASCTPG